MDMDEEEDDESWVECPDEDDEDVETVRCLFCDEIFRSADMTFVHCEDAHNFDIAQIQKHYKLDCFNYIKMINYIRKQRPGPQALEGLFRDIPPPWHTDDYLKPAIPDDPLLQFYVSESDDEEKAFTSINTTTLKASPSVGDDQAALLEKVKRAEARAEMAEERMQSTQEMLKKLKSFTADLFSSDVSTKPQTVEALSTEEDSPYFSSYDNLDIHEEMLKDKVRTEGYRDFILGNKEVFHGKVVLDIGCGTGILSMFAAQAGAKQVFAIDQSEIVYQAMDIIRENNLEDVVTVIKGKVEEVDLPVNKVDIIISEWMGYFLLFESMLDTVLYARDKWLQPEGRVYPDHCSLFLTAISDIDLYKQSIAFWENVYGFKMSSLKRLVLKETTVGVVKPETVCSDTCVLKEITVAECSMSDVDFTAGFQLTALRDCTMTAFVGYFDIKFNHCQNKVSFSTGPGTEQTHWKQTIFFLESPLEIKKDEVIKCRLTCRKARNDPRSLAITISHHGKSQHFFME